MLASIKKEQTLNCHFELPSVVHLVRFFRNTQKKQTEIETRLLKFCYIFVRRLPLWLHYRSLMLSACVWLTISLYFDIKLASVSFLPRIRYLAIASVHITSRSRLLSTEYMCPPMFCPDNAPRTLGRCVAMTNKYFIWFKAIWRAPPKDNKCVTIYAVLAVKRDVWYNFEGPLSKRICEDSRNAEDMQPMQNDNCRVCEDARYLVMLSDDLHITIDTITHSTHHRSC